MRRFIGLIIACLVISLLAFFGNSFINKSNAQTSPPPVANDDGIYVVRTPTGPNSLNVHIIEPAPGYLANDSWSEAINYYLQRHPDHASFIDANYPAGGGFSYTSSGTYAGWDSFDYILVNGTLPYASDIATVSLVVIPQDGAEDAGYVCPVPVKGASSAAGSSAAGLSAVGEPVNVTNGNMWLEQMDYNLPGIGENIAIKRFYNSIIPATGLFGKGWSTKYDESIQAYSGDQMLRLNLPDGRAVYFGRGNTTDPFKAALMGFYGEVVKNSNGTYTLTFKDGRIHQFSSTGKLFWQKDRNGNQTNLSYDTNGNLTGITDAFSRTLTVTPNTNGTIASISDSISTIATYEYYASTTLLKTVTYNDGSMYKFEYNSTNGKLETVKDYDDNILETHQYDTDGRATTSEKEGGVEKYTLDYSHWSDSSPYTLVKYKKNVSDPYIETKYYFDKSKGRNLITKTEGVCGCGGSGSEVTTYEYDAALNLVKKTDALSNQTVYTYDGNGNRLSMTDVLGTETYTYNLFGQRLKRTDRMGFFTWNHYDSKGNLTSFENELGDETVLGYTSIGQLETILDARGHTTSITYNTQGSISRITDANTKHTDFTYDARARLLSATNALNHTTSYEYDLNNRLEKVTHPDTTFVAYDYDLNGRKTSMTDERGNTTTYAYDGAYRLTSITDALNHTTSFGYDLMSNMKSVTDALNHTTDYQYDDFNRLKKIIYPPATTSATRLEEEVQYNQVGKIKKRTDTANRETLFDYDAAHRLIKITDPLNQITQFYYNARSETTKVKDALNQEYTFTYDQVGRRTTQTRAGSTMTFAYDHVGNQTYRTDYSGRITTYTYDNLNRLTNIVYNSSSNFADYVYDDMSRLTEATNQIGTVSFNYDNRNRLTSTTDVFNHEIEYSYDENGNRTGMELDGQPHALYFYDEANRLTQMRDEVNAHYTFNYDAANRLTSRVLPNGVETVYNYDDINRLTRLKHQTLTTTLFDNQYAYNPAQQISQIAELAKTRNFTYDDTDRLTNVANPTSSVENFTYDAVGNRTLSHQSSFYNYDPFNRLIETDSYNYSYDANGNRTEKSNYIPQNGPVDVTTVSDTNLYNWDEENRLVGVRGDRFEVYYQYDALGRRVKRVADRDETAYIYDGVDVIMDDDASTGVTIYQNAPGIDKKLKLKNSGVDQYFLTDHLGSTIGLASSSGSLTDSASYDSFGNTAKKNFPTRYRFTGREFDETTGLYYYRARWYDPQIGRFISEDPIKFKGGINWFAYVKNNPVNFIDPKGFCPSKDKPCDGQDNPKLWNKPQFGEGPYTNQNPFTSIESGDVTSFWDSPFSTIGNGICYYGNLFIKGFFGDLGARGAGGGVPGGGEMINTLELGPDLYNTLDTVDRRNQDINDALRCAQGDCTPSPYKKGNGLGRW